MKRIVRMLLVFFALGMTACAAVQEIAPPGGEDVLKNPQVKSVTDTTQIKQITGKIQSSTENLLSGSVVKKNGKYVLSISAEDLAQLGVSLEEYKAYCIKLNKLNSNE